MRLHTKVKVNSLANFMTLKYRTKFFNLDWLPVNYQATTETDNHTDDQFKNTTNVCLWRRTNNFGNSVNYCIAVSLYFKNKLNT